MVPLCLSLSRQASSTPFIIDTDHRRHSWRRDNLLRLGVDLELGRRYLGVKHLLHADDDIHIAPFLTSLGLLHGCFDDFGQVLCL
jgi:hypothetical protein